MSLSIGMVTIDCSDPQSLAAEHSAPGLWWTVLTDPEGNEFCVGSHHG
jgi:hypothetical protein